MKNIKDVHLTNFLVTLRYVFNQLIYQLMIKYIVLNLTKLIF